MSFKTGLAKILHKWKNDEKSDSQETLPINQKKSLLILISNEIKPFSDHKISAKMTFM